MKVELLFIGVGGCQSNASRTYTGTMAIDISEHYSRDVDCEYVIPALASVTLPHAHEVKNIQRTHR